MEFRHVDEVYRDGGYDYSYSKVPLDSTEIRQLASILEKRGYKYVVRNNQLFYDRPDYFHIQTEFDIDRELVDSIVAKQLPQSQFVKQLLKNLNQ